MSLNPISSLTMGAAAGDLGLSNQAQSDAAEVADRAKKKKMQDEKDAAAAGTAAAPSNAYRALTGAGSF
jgi:hypothetical protein